MTRKFGRNYRLTINPIDGGDPIIITMPFTIRFSLTRDINSRVNPMTLEIYNLSETNRRRIFQDWNDLGDELPDATFNNITLEIGYETLYQVYKGRMTFAGSAREGANVVTRIEAMDGMFAIARTQTFQTLQEGQSLSDILKFLAGEFKASGIDLGAIGEYEEVFTRPVTLNGNTWELIKQYSGYEVFIDKGVLYAMKDKEVLSNIHIINSSTGLLETPRREQANLEVTMMMEAGIEVADQVRLQSSIQTEYDGTYKVLGLTHRGTISAAVSEDMITRLRLAAPYRFKGFTVLPWSRAA